MRDYERIYSRFSAAAAATTVRDDAAVASRIGVQITKKGGRSLGDAEGNNLAVNVSSRIAGARCI